MSNDGYENYEDWYDNGPGSESFKRKVRQSELEFLKKQKFPFSIGRKKTKNKKNGKNLKEQLDALERRLNKDVKLSPFTRTRNGLLEEIVKNGRRLLKYVEELEND